MWKYFTERRYNLVDALGMSVLSAGVATGYLFIALISMFAYFIISNYIEKREK